MKHANPRVSEKSSAYVTAFIEGVVLHLMRDAAEHAKQAGRMRVTSADIRLAARDKKYRGVIKPSQVLAGGVSIE